MIPYARQDIDAADIEAVVTVLRSDWITQGPTIERFERLVGDYCGARYALAVNSGTSGLHLACRSLGVGPGDVVWTSPNSFVASANAALYCGAEVDFVDIDANSLNLCPKALEAKLRLAASKGRLPKVVIPVHFGGEPCDMEPIGALAKRYGFAVVEDAAHALGARYGQHKIGMGAHSDITVLSFHPVKIITTGEGGMVLTQNPELFKRLSLLRSHGITRDPASMSKETEGPWYSEQLELGYNYRITDIQAALGASQMRRIDQFLARRHQIAERYDKELKDLPLVTPHRRPSAFSALHLYVIQLELEKLKRTRRDIFESLRTAGINVNVHFIPIHLQPYYRNLGFKRGDFPASERYYDRAVTIPMFPALTDQEQDRVILAIREALSAN